MTDDAHLDKAHELLLGAALGDALGARFEFASTVDDAALAAVEQGDAALNYTDDTAMTLVLAEHLAARQLVEDELAREFAAAWRAEPGRGYGSGAHQVLGLIDGGTPWAEAARTAFRPDGSYGSGAAMRVGPTALVARDLAEAAELARRSAAITHAHPDGRDGALAGALHGARSLPARWVRRLEQADRLRALAGVLAAERRTRTIPAGVRVELSRGRVLPGAGAEVECWMAMLNERAEECVATLDGERMAVEAVFRLTAEHGDWLYWFSIQGEDGGGLDFDVPVNRDHVEFAKRCNSLIRARIGS